MTGRRQTVVLVGAGSVVFTQVLVADFARTCPPEGLRLGQGVPAHAAPQPAKHARSRRSPSSMCAAWTAP
jgi:hypothetical protein